MAERFQIPIRCVKYVYSPLQSTQKTCETEVCTLVCALGEVYVSFNFNNL